MLEKVHPDWQPLIDDQRELLDSILDALRDADFIPGADKVFRAFEVPPQHYRVLIMGQDPYPNPEHAIGLAFAVPPQTKKLPPSLRNILRELKDDIGVELGGPANLVGWQQAGVMLLNRHLTTRAGESAGHFSLGWDRFTLAAIRFLVARRERKMGAILWGNSAQQIAAELAGVPIISSPHPSPLSAHRGFFGSRPFSRCNSALLELGEKPIDWSS